MWLFLFLIRLDKHIMGISYQSKDTLIKNKMNFDNKKGLLEQQQNKKIIRNVKKVSEDSCAFDDKETTYSKKSTMIRLLMIIPLTSLVFLVQYQEQHAYAQSSDLPSQSQTTPSEDRFASARERDRQAEAQYRELVGPSAASIQIIEEVRSECESSNFMFVGSQCVTLVYESPNTVVLDAGLLLISTDFSGSFSGNWDNPFVWKAVDRFKGLGYLVTSVELSGQGSQANPHRWHIVMSK